MSSRASFGHSMPIYPRGSVLKGRGSLRLLSFVMHSKSNLMLGGSSSMSNRSGFRMRKSRHSVRREGDKSSTKTSLWSIRFEGCCMYCCWSAVKKICGPSWGLVPPNKKIWLPWNKINIDIGTYFHDFSTKGGCFFPKEHALWHRK